MKKLKHAFFMAGLAVVSGSVTIPSYACYTGSTAASENAFRAPSVIMLNFNANGGSGSMSSISLVRADGNVLPFCSFAKTDSAFAGWNTRADGGGSSVEDGAPVTALTAPGTEITLYAQWEDETGILIEPRWDQRTGRDADGNGVPDRLELEAGDTCIKDPSLRNETDADVYGYILVSVPAVSAKMSGNSSPSVYDAVSLNTTSHWIPVRSSVSNSSSVCSKYLYRYDTTLKAYGSSGTNPYDPGRSSYRSTDLMTGFTVRHFAEGPALTASIDVCGVLVEAAVTTAEADAIAADRLTAAGLL